MLPKRQSADPSVQDMFVKLLAVLLPSELRTAGSNMQTALTQVADRIQTMRTRSFGSVELPVMADDEAANLDALLKVDETWRLVREQRGIKVWAQMKEDDTYVPPHVRTTRASTCAHVPHACHAAPGNMCASRQRACCTRQLG